MLRLTWVVFVRWEGGTLKCGKRETYMVGPEPGMCAGFGIAGWEEGHSGL